MPDDQLRRVFNRWQDAAQRRLPAMGAFESWLDGAPDLAPLYARAEFVDTHGQAKVERVGGLYQRYWPADIVGKQFTDFIDDNAYRHFLQSAAALTYWTRRPVLISGPFFWESGDLWAERLAFPLDGTGLDHPSHIGLVLQVSQSDRDPNLAWQSVLNTEGDMEADARHWPEPLNTFYRLWREATPDGAPGADFARFEATVDATPAVAEIYHRGHYLDEFRGIQVDRVSEQVEKHFGMRLAGRPFDETIRNATFRNFYLSAINLVHWMARPVLISTSSGWDGGFHWYDRLLVPLWDGPGSQPSHIAGAIAFSPNTGDKPTRLAVLGRAGASGRRHDGATAPAATARCAARARHRHPHRRTLRTGLPVPVRAGQLAALGRGARHARA